jgi:hypothetical protein
MQCGYTTPVTRLTTSQFARFANQTLGSPFSGAPRRPIRLASLSGVYGYQGREPTGEAGDGSVGDPSGGESMPGAQPPTLTPALADAIRAFAIGAMTPEDFQDIFAVSRVYCPRGDKPGFLALHDTPEPVIPMFSCLAELRRYAGEQSRYFSVTGAEILDLIPEGYGIVLDIDGEHRVMFDAGAIEQVIAYSMRRLYG